jgi:hypothetical protein
VLFMLFFCIHFSQVPEFLPHMTILVGLAPNDGVIGIFYSFFNSAVERESRLFRAKLMRDTQTFSSTVQLSEMK